MTTFGLVTDADITRVIDDCLAILESLLESRPKGQSNDDTAGSYEAVENLLARFRLWAGNIRDWYDNHVIEADERQPRGELSEVSNWIVDLLEKFQKTVTVLQEILSGTRETRRIQGKDNAKDENDEFNQLFLSAEDIITSLMTAYTEASIATANDRKFRAASSQSQRTSSASDTGWTTASSLPRASGSGTAMTAASSQQQRTSSASDTLLRTTPSPQRASSGEISFQSENEILITSKLTHKPIRATSFTIKSDLCEFRDASGHIVFLQRFPKEFEGRLRHPWRRDPDNRLQVTFASIEHGNIEISTDENMVMQKGIPVYCFRSQDKYRDFQTELRGKTFVRDFETFSIETKSIGTRNSVSQTIKVWQDSKFDKVYSVTMPVEVGGYFKFPELNFRQFHLEKRELNIFKLPREKRKTHRQLRLVLNNAKHKTSPDPNTTRLDRKISKTFNDAFGGTLRSLKVRTPSIGSDKIQTEPADSAPIKYLEAYAYFDIIFTSVEDFEDFKELHISETSKYMTTSQPLVSHFQPYSMVGETQAMVVQPHPIMARPVLQPISAHPEPQLQISPTNNAQPFWDRHMPPSAVSGGSGILPAPAINDYSPTAQGAEYLRKSGPRNTNIFQASDELRLNKEFYDDLKEDDSIRLLRIRHDEFEQPLACKLEQCSLRHAPDYEAVSYCWGEVGDTASIMIGSKNAFKVSSHLWAGLRRLRRQDRDRLVWIDAICINQNNNKEKNQQIPQMRNIYSKAYRTLIWIGDLDDAGENCSRVYPAEEDSPGADDTLCVSLSNNQSQMDHGSVADMRRRLQEFKVRLHASRSTDVWWRRLWVFQEYHFSSRVPVVFIGSHSFDWRHFATFFSTAQDVSSPLAIFEGLRGPDFVDRKLFSLILSSGSLHCGDLRDRVYGLLSMAPKAANVIVPDYDRSVLRVLEDTCEYLVTESESVDVLLDHRLDRTRWGPSELKDVFPTWMPELTSLLPSHVVKGADGCMSGTGMKGDYRAQIELQPEQTTPVFDRPRRLKIQGIRFGTIVRRTTRNDIFKWQESPSGSLIYNSLDQRGPLLESILDTLEYEYKSPSKWKLEKSPCLGRLMHVYLFEEAHSFIEEQKRRSDGDRINVVKACEDQEHKDLAYVRDYASNSPEDIKYVQNRWALKIARAQQEKYIPKRIEEAVKSDGGIEDDFHVARDFENLFAYARNSGQRYYFIGKNFDAPMQSDILAESTVLAANNLPSRYKEVRRGAPDPEYHEYNPKNRERDFFITDDGFLGLGPSTLEPDDVVVVPHGSSRPWILRPELEGKHIVYSFIGEAVVPGIMSGKLLSEENAKAEGFVLK